MQVQTDSEVDYNVGTLIDDFVYNTIAQWYNEDMGPNNTLPLSPSPGGQHPISSSPSPAVRSSRAHCARDKAMAATQAVCNPTGVQATPC